MSIPSSLLPVDASPWRLSGVVYGTLLNHIPALQALGEAVHRAPYKAPPRAPVLYLKPRNTLNHDGGSVCIPHGTPAVEVGASLGIVLGRTACRLRAEEALDWVAGYTIANDVCVPHDVFYRPSIRLRARDGFCPLGPTVVPRAAIGNPDALRVQVFIDDVLQQDTSTGERLRPVAQLLADVTEFMTLQPGDVLLLGVAAHAPQAGAGQRSRIVMEGLGALVNHYCREGDAA